MVAALRSIVTIVFLLGSICQSTIVKAHEITDLVLLPSGELAKESYVDARKLKVNRTFEALLHRGLTERFPCRTVHGVDYFGSEIVGNGYLSSYLQDRGDLMSGDPSSVDWHYIDKLFGKHEEGFVIGILNVGMGSECSDDECQVELVGRMVVYSLIDREWLVVTIGSGVKKISGMSSDVPFYENLASVKFIPLLEAIIDNALDQFEGLPRIKLFSSCQ